MSLYPKRDQDEVNKLFWDFVDANYTVPEQYGLISAAAPLFEGSGKHCAECFGVNGAHASWCTYKRRNTVYDQDEYGDPYGEDYA